MATDYPARLAKDRSAAAMDARVKRVRQIYQNLGPWIRKYHGGFPVGYAAAAIQWESDGKMVAGDVSLGEIGFLQVTKYFPPEIGLPADARNIPEVNVFLGMMEYQIESIRMHLAEPKLKLGSPDAWKMARLAFAIGSYGARTIMKEAAPRDSNVWAAVLRYIDAKGGRQFGSQSAAKVWYRVHTCDVVWEIGQRAIPGRGGVPRLPPNPPGYTYKVPSKLRPYFDLPSTTEFPLVPVAALALGVLLLTRS